MDMWLYYDVTHRDHTFCNPISAPRVDELGRVLGLGPKTRVLDIACGMGEMLVRWHEQHGISGIGVDLSTAYVEYARQRIAERVPDADLEIVEMDAKEYASDERFDVALCIGASWIWDGYEGTIQALRDFVKPGGLVVSGEPFWLAEPCDEYLEAEGITREQFHTEWRCLEIARKHGLSLLWMAGSSLEEWDNYELSQPAAVERFARENPDHPELAEIRAQRERADEIYLRWGRRTMGFANWVFRT